jgi:predicted Zn-dependent peptidase
MVVSLMLLVPCFCWANDPAADMRLSHLDNGLRVIYAPSKQAKTVQIRLRVDAGRWSQDVSGVAHLLEHYVFKDAKMEKDMTYLEVIKEHGGSGNAFVDDKTTTYYATVPGGKEEWLLHIFGKMLIHKQFIEQDVEFAKGPVYLEIGQPNPLDYLSSAVDYLIPDGLELFPGFWQTEFGRKTPSENPFSDRITTAGLKAEQLKRFYEKYYHAGNMTLFIAGNFDPARTEETVKKIFSALPSGEAHGPEVVLSSAKMRPYVRSSATSGTSRMEVGTKVYDITLKQSLALRIYLNHLSHRLMKEIRNERGQTYTARPVFNIEKRSGYASIEMESPREAYYKNLKLLRETLENEATQGKITPELYRQAMDLYESKFELVDQDSSTMMDMAEGMDRQFREYAGDVRTPSALFQSLDEESYKKALQSVFRPDMHFERLTEPYLVFRYEGLLLLFAGIVFWSGLARKLFAQKFDHRKIRWVRKIKVPPAYSFQIGALMGMLFFCSLAEALLFHFWVEAPYVHGSFLISDYLFSQISLGAMYFVAQTWFMLLPRKLMVVRDELWIKSLGYGSRRIPLERIESVKTRRIFWVLLSPKTLWRMKHRCYFGNIKFWEPGVLIQLKNKKVYFLSLTEPRRACKELRVMVEDVSPKHTPYRAVA